MSRAAAHSSSYPAHHYERSGSLTGASEKESRALLRSGGPFMTRAGERASTRCRTSENDLPARGIGENRQKRNDFARQLRLGNGRPAAAAPTLPSRGSHRRPASPPRGAPPISVWPHTPQDRPRRRANLSQDNRWTEKLRKTPGELRPKSHASTMRQLTGCRRRNALESTTSSTPRSRSGEPTRRPASAHTPLNGHLYLPNYGPIGTASDVLFPAPPSVSPTRLANGLAGAYRDQLGELEPEIIRASPIWPTPRPPGGARPKQRVAEDALRARSRMQTSSPACVRSPLRRELVLTAPRLVRLVGAHVS
jgi:hypothetical protein